MRRNRFSSFIGFSLLIAGIIGLAHGGLEAAMGPRIDQMFIGPPADDSTRILVSFAMGAAGLIAGIVLLVTAEKHPTDPDKHG